MCPESLISLIWRQQYLSAGRSIPSRPLEEIDHMAHSNSAKKRIRQNITNRARNRWRMKNMRAAIKSFEDAISSGSNEEASTAYRAASATVDRTAQVGVIHSNQASRRKSRMNARLKAKVQG
jgi:small subunit ribosomal protein S20